MAHAAVVVAAADVGVTNCQSATCFCCCCWCCWPRSYKVRGKCVGDGEKEAVEGVLNLRNAAGEDGAACCCCCCCCCCC